MRIPETMDLAVADVLVQFVLSSVFPASSEGTTSSQKSVALAARSCFSDCSFMSLFRTR